MRTSLLVLWRLLRALERHALRFRVRPKAEVSLWKVFGYHFASIKGRSNTYPNSCRHFDLYQCNLASTIDCWSWPWQTGWLNKEYWNEDTGSPVAASKTKLHKTTPINSFWNQSEYDRYGLFKAFFLELKNQYATQRFQEPRSRRAPNIFYDSEILVIMIHHRRKSKLSGLASTSTLFWETKRMASSLRISGTNLKLERLLNPCSLAHTWRPFGNRLGFPIYMLYMSNASVQGTRSSQT